MRRERILNKENGPYDVTKMRLPVLPLSLGQRGRDRQRNPARLLEGYPRRASFLAPSSPCPYPVCRSGNTGPITPYRYCLKLPRRGLIGQDRKIPYVKDFLDAFRYRLQTSYLADAASIALARAAEPCFENPCVGGSIPPRATKNIPHATPTHAGWRFCFWDSQSSCPVYCRSQSQMSRWTAVNLLRLLATPHHGEQATVTGVLQ